MVDAHQRAVRRRRLPADHPASTPPRAAARCSEFYRAADLCYVSSLHDGMNLVAKEFVAARDDEQGVLVLSRFTGAARELTEALIVNPYDLDEARDALRRGADDAADEQRERMRAMRALVAEFNVYRWAGRMLVDATRLRQRERLRDRLRRASRRGVSSVRPVSNDRALVEGNDAPRSISPSAVKPTMR